MNLVVMLIFILMFCVESQLKTDERSPYFQHLPDCSNGNYLRIQKKTEKKGIVCPMIKDEVGFLSEFTAFYEIQGFNHIIFFDNNSTSSLSELDPWIKSGFVTIIKDWWYGTPGIFTNKRNKFNDMMRIKMMAEAKCKEIAVKWGYEIFASVDLDEYLLPINIERTVVDEMVEWFEITTRGVMLIPKMNFPPVPHILEPINLLTIEAYQTRMRDGNKMNYYNSVANKVGLRLLGSKEYSNKTIEYLTYCCDFHGCSNHRFHHKCHELYQAGERWNIEGKHRKWRDTPHMNHYARSLEKFMLKAGTWDTAAPGRGYDLYHYLDRTLGFEFDNSATFLGCQIRELLRNRTGIQDYVRPGDFWYRNPEFGRVVTNPSKRGRNGAGYGKVLGFAEMNPYPPGETYQRAHRAYDPNLNDNK